MTQLIVRNIEAEVKIRLKRRAALHGRSMEEEIRDILRDASKDELPMAGGLGSEMAALFQNVGLDEDIRELRGYTVKPVEFEG